MRRAAEAATLCLHKSPAQIDAEQAYRKHRDATWPVRGDSVST
jgi:hypothetical protein